MNEYTKEEMRSLLEESKRIREASEERVKNAADQILAISSQLHLTMAEFERAISEASATARHYAQIAYSPESK